MKSSAQARRGRPGKSREILVAEGKRRGLFGTLRLTENHQTAGAKAPYVARRSETGWRKTKLSRDARGGTWLVAQGRDWSWHHEEGGTGENVRVVAFQNRVGPKGALLVHLMESRTGRLSDESLAGSAGKCNSVISSLLEEMSTGAAVRIDSMTS